MVRVAGRKAPLKPGSGQSPDHRALLRQTPHYLRIHIHSLPYLVTLGDTITLPALLYGPPSPTKRKKVRATREPRKMKTLTYALVATLGKHPNYTAPASI